MYRLNASDWRRRLRLKAVQVLGSLLEELTSRQHSAARASLMASFSKQRWRATLTISRYTSSTDVNDGSAPSPRSLLGAIFWEKAMPQGN